MIARRHRVRHRDREGVSALSASGGVIFIRTDRRLVRPMVIKARPPEACSVVCLPAMTGVPPGCARKNFGTAVMTAVHHQKLDLPEGFGVFAMAANPCVFS